MHPQKAVLVHPSSLQPGDKIPLGRGPWAVVEEIHRAKGRPPTSGPNLVIVTGRGNAVVSAGRWLRAIRK